MSEEQLRNTLKEYKPQPLPSVRKRLLLKNWKWTACRASTPQNVGHNFIPNLKDVSIANGYLSIETDQTINYDFTTQAWRLSFNWRAQVSSTNQKISFILSNSDKMNGIVVGFDEQGKIFYKKAQKIKHAQKY